MTYNGSSWGAPATIDSTNGLESVSCMSAYCIAVDNVGNALLYNGSTWTPTGISPSGIPAVSCALTGFCMAVDADSNYETYSMSAWTSPASTNDFSTITSVSCVSADFCVGVDTDGAATVYGPAPATPAPVSSAPPSISGTAQEGQTLIESHGTWSNSPTGFTYQWQQCDSSGNSCTAITGATSQTYVVAAGDVGHTIRVVEAASNAGGAGAPATSAATGVVSAAPASGGGSGGGSTTSSGGGSTTTPAPTPTPPAPSAPSAAQIVAALRAGIAPVGPAASIKSILKTGASTVTFTAPGAGLLKITWFFVPKGAKLASVKPVKVAAGSMSFASARQGKVKLKLTAAGRKLLKKLKRVALTAEGTFTPSGGQPVRVKKTFSLKR